MYTTKSISSSKFTYGSNQLRLDGMPVTKEAIGRVRSKYSVTGSPFELDGEKLLEEGKAEQLECLDYLANKPVFTILK